MADRFANQGKIVLVSALDGDFKRVPFDAAQGFGDIAKLISRAEKVKKLSAICVQCKCDNAAFTAKIAGNKDATKEIGGADLYVPLCRKCYFTTPHANSENL
jgi:thymidine kinase